MVEGEKVEKDEGGMGMFKFLLRLHQAYINAGADMLFPEALTELSQYERFTKAFPTIPVLANLTEFGKTQLFTVSDLAKVSHSH